MVVGGYPHAVPGQAGPSRASRTVCFQWCASVVVVVVVVDDDCPTVKTCLLGDVDVGRGVSGLAARSRDRRRWKEPRERNRITVPWENRGGGHQVGTGDLVGFPRPNWKNRHPEEKGWAGYAVSSRDGVCWGVFRDGWGWLHFAALAFALSHIRTKQSSRNNRNKTTSDEHCRSTSPTTSFFLYLAVSCYCHAISLADLMHISLFW